MIRKFSRIHFIGIGGIGVSALARLQKLLGAEVSGSDIRASDRTESLKSLGCRIIIGHAPENISPGTELVVHTEDVNENSSGFVELEKARSMGITTKKYSEALGEMVAERFGVGVTGTNGKSTTTAMLGLILEHAGLDPMVVLGSQLAKKDESDAFQGNARFGKGRYFVYEADEYHRHMLDSNPRTAIITNIEEDHLDYYRDLKDIKSAFTTFTARIPEDGVLAYNQDDVNCSEPAQFARCKKITFSRLDPSADYYLSDLEILNGRQSFSVAKQGISFGEFTINLPGIYNAMNALGAITMASELGIGAEVISQTLANFHGIWRRFEIVGKIQGRLIISDYAHHPTAVEGVLKAVKEFYPGKKVLTVFQPHQKNRTKKLYKEFIAALSSAESLVLTEVFSVEGREKPEDAGVSSKPMSEALASSGTNCAFAGDLHMAESIVNEKLQFFDIVMFLGAGNIDQLARKLVQ